jgi:hypothetical protein
MCATHHHCIFSFTWSLRAAHTGLLKRGPGHSGPTRLRMRISAPQAAGPASGPWAASGPEELRHLERSHGCQRDAMTVCFQYLVLQVTDSDDSSIYSELAQLHSELGVAILILPFELWPLVLKQTPRKLVSLVTTQICVWVSLT